MEEYTVREISKHIGKSEETIKRWIRSGKFPNTYMNSDKEGWRIPKSDFIAVAVPDILKINQVDLEETIEYNNDKNLTKTAYEAVTLDTPSEDVLNILSYVGIKRTLDILLLWRQCSNSVEPTSFIRQAITEGWSTSNPPKI